MLGICALVLLLFGLAALGSVFLGAVGIVLAVRAKNTGDCSGVRRAGFILSLLGAIFGGPVFFAFYYMLTAAQLF